ncbi:MAG TPA: hypothetical protein PLU88_05110 [Armatimonadota bacterium]|nr:hypothetical protein [Armatimonadota bacterium]
MKVVLTALVAGVLALSVVVPVTAAPNIFGTSGLIEVPDDRVLPTGTIAPAFHTIVDVDILGTDTDFNFFTVGIGITENLEVSGGVVDNDDSEVILNAKYRLSPRVGNRPSITIGVVDVTSDIDDDPSFYILFARGLTGVAEDITDDESVPLRGYLGFGSGLYEGVFVGLEWMLSPRFVGMVEYVDEGITGSDFNAGIRYALTNQLRIDAGLVDLDSFTVGISYTGFAF